MATLGNCEIFSIYYFPYVRDYKAALRGGNYVTHTSEAAARRCSVKKCSQKFRRGLQPFLKNRLWHSCFPVNFVKFLRTPFLTKHFRWLLLGFQSESTLDSFRTSCSKQVQYLKVEWIGTLWKYSRSNSSKKFLLLCCRLRVL